MANFTKTYAAEDPSDYTFDSSLIEYLTGFSPKLKTLPLFSGLSLYLRTNGNATDSSNATNTTTATDITYTTGLIEQEAVLNGTTSKILVSNAVWTGSGVLKVGISLWIKQTLSAVTRVFTHDKNGKYFRIEIRNQNEIRVVDLVGQFLGATGLSLSARSHVAINITENGASELFVNGVSVDTGTADSFTGLGSDNIYIGCNRLGTASFFTGTIEQLLIKDDAIFSAQEISDIYNSGLGELITQYSASSPTLRQNTPSTDVQLASYGGYSVVSSGTGSLAFRLSDDDYVTTEYWNGSAWDSTGSSYNNESTINTNIGTFSAVSQQISTDIAFVSDGFTQIELTSEQINYAVNIAPTINAGLDKPTGGQPAITDIASFVPYSDSSFSDSDGTITNAYTSYNGGAFVEISQGIYATLLEAVQAYSFQASTIGIGTHTFTLKVKDNLGSESQDSVLITITDSIESVVNDNNAKLVQLLADVATIDTNVDTINANTEDIHDCHLGSERAITVGGVQTIKRKDTTTLATYNTYNEQNAQTNEDITKVVKQ